MWPLSRDVAALAEGVAPGRGPVRTPVGKESFGQVMALAAPKADMPPLDAPRATTDPFGITAALPQLAAFPEIIAAINNAVAGLEQGAELNEAIGAVVDGLPQDIREALGQMLGLTASSDPVPAVLAGLGTAGVPLASTEGAMQDQEAPGPVQTSDSEIPDICRLEGGRGDLLLRDAKNSLGISSSAQNMLQTVAPVATAAGGASVIQPSPPVSPIGSDGVLQVGLDPMPVQDTAATLRGTTFAADVAGSRPTFEAAPTLPNHVAQKIRNADLKEGKLKLELAPHGIGQLEIEIAKGDNGRLSVVLRAESAAVLSMIRNDRDTLVAALASRGLEADAGDLDFQNFQGNSDQSAFQDKYPAASFGKRAEAEPVVLSIESTSAQPGLNILT